MDRCDLEIPLKISVVIPAYNAEKYLKEALDSVLAQALPAHEIIVVDDGSTDSTADICKGYSNQILYIKQDNMGLSGARNTGITAATGEWIALLDADDIMLPNRLEVQAGIAAHHADLIVVYSAFTYLYPDGKQSFAQAFPAKDLWPALRYRTPILPSTTMIRRSALLEVGLFRNRIVEDWDLWFRLIKRYTSRAFQEATREPCALSQARYKPQRELSEIGQGNFPHSGRVAPLRSYGNTQIPLEAENSGQVLLPRSRLDAGRWKSPLLGVCD